MGQTYRPTSENRYLHISQKETPIPAPPLRQTWKIFGRLYSGLWIVFWHLYFSNIYDVCTSLRHKTKQPQI
jgi:hypothetical protein